MNIMTHATLAFLHILFHLSSWSTLLELAPLLNMDHYPHRERSSDLSSPRIQPTSLSWAFCQTLVKDVGYSLLHLVSTSEIEPGGAIRAVESICDLL